MKTMTEVRAMLATIIQSDAGIERMLKLMRNGTLAEKLHYGEIPLPRDAAKAAQITKTLLAANDLYTEMENAYFDEQEILLEQKGEI